MTRTLTDGEVLLRAIIADPPDDTPRLQYSDWLEEQGDPDSLSRAEFIRAQIKISRLPSYCYDSGQAICDVCGKVTSEGVFGDDCEGEACSLFRRCLCRARYHNQWIGNLRITTLRHEFRRGFVSIISTSLNHWLNGGKSAVLEHPIERVVITDKKPLQYNDVSDNQDITYRFFEDNLPPGIGTGMIASVFVPANRLPSILFAWNPKLRSHFISENDAMEELSKTCISIATPSRLDSANLWKKPNLFFSPHISTLLRPSEKH